MVSHFFVSSLVTIAFASSVTAQNSTTQLLLPGGDGRPFPAANVVGSVVGSNGTVRTYDLKCTADHDDSNFPCRLPTPFTVVEGVNTVTYTATQSDATTALACYFDSQGVDCSGSVVGGPSEGSVLYNAQGFLPVTVIVTAGQEALATSLATPPTTTPPPSSGAMSTGAASSTSGAVSSRPSNAAGPDVTGVGTLGGAVAFVAVAVLAL